MKTFLKFCQSVKILPNLITPVAFDTAISEQSFNLTVWLSQIWAISGLFFITFPSFSSNICSNLEHKTINTNYQCIWTYFGQLKATAMEQTCVYLGILRHTGFRFHSKQSMEKKTDENVKLTFSLLIDLLEQTENLFNQ